MFIPITDYVDKDCQIIVYDQARNIRCDNRVRLAAFYVNIV